MKLRHPRDLLLCAQGELLQVNKELTGWNPSVLSASNIKSIATDRSLDVQRLFLRVL